MTLRYSIEVGRFLALYFFTSTYICRFLPSAPIVLVTFWPKAEHTATRLLFACLQAF